MRFVRTASKMNREEGVYCRKASNIEKCRCKERERERGGRGDLDVYRREGKGRVG